MIIDYVSHLYWYLLSCIVCMLALESFKKYNFPHMSCVTDKIKYKYNYLFRLGQIRKLHQNKWVLIPKLVASTSNICNGDSEHSNLVQYKHYRRYWNIYIFSRFLGVKWEGTYRVEKGVSFYSWEYRLVSLNR